MKSTSCNFVIVWKLLRFNNRRNHTQKISAECSPVGIHMFQHFQASYLPWECPKSVQHAKAIAAESAKTEKVCRDKQGAEFKIHNVSYSLN